MNLIIFIKAFLNTYLRKVYSLQRASKIKFGSSPKILLALKVSGKGKIIFGNDAILASGVSLAVSEKSVIQFGANCSLSKNVQIICGENGMLTTGSNFSIGQDSTLIIQNTWDLEDSINIASNCQISSRERNYYGKLNLGFGSSIGDGTIMDISDDILVGKNVSIGPQCIMYTHDHNYTENFEVPWKGKPITKPIIIEDGAWIGAGVIILPGVRIGKGAIIAAGAVLKKDVAPHVIIAGIPGKTVKDLKNR
jgi:acetyltransferase-like isoleucine patch superfamily enzyme